jgi:hypothetical protein
MYGMVPVEAQATKTFKLVNHGSKAAPFRLEWDKWVTVVAFSALPESTWL